MAGSPWSPKAPAPAQGRLAGPDGAKRLLNLAGAGHGATAVRGVADRDLELASGSGLQFVSLDNFYGNSALYLDDLRMVGPSVGLTAEGSVDFGGRRFGVEGNVTPLTCSASSPGRCPSSAACLLARMAGRVLSGYRIDGTFDTPEVTVNLFQVLTPGVYRQWFQDISTTEPEGRLLGAVMKKA